MPKIIPFKAVRPTRDKIGLVATRSYESYSKEGRTSRMERNPYSFLHILNPGYKYQKEISGRACFELVRNRYQEFKEDGIFIQEDTAAYYAYKIIDRDGNVFFGILGAASVEDYKNNHIKRHEDTIADREELFKEYLDTVGFNAEAVLLTYPDNDVLARILKEKSCERPEYEFTTTHRDTHYLWTIQDAQSLQIIEDAFTTIEHLYIADGHHRSSSSYLLAKEHEEKTDASQENNPYNFFMSYLIPESDLIIKEFNRLITDLNGLSKEAFLIQLDAHFRIENRGVIPYKPSKKHHFSMYMDGAFYSLYLRKNLYQITNSLEALDTHILQQTILEPILGIKDIRNNKRIAYSDGKKDITYVKSLVDSGDFSVGFGMLPITIHELKEVANQGYTMPPKSTYIEPKLRSGVTIYEF